jgi:hypothetical protein
VIRVAPSAAGARVTYVERAVLEAGVAELRGSPADAGRLDLIVRRPAVDEREILEVGVLDLVEGLVGDSWRYRRSSRRPEAAPHPDKQLNIMNARAAALMAGGPDGRHLAGDQLFVDLDLSEANLPAGTTLQVGDAVIEVTAQPHTGCHKFSARFGPDALRFVNSPIGRELRLRGICARVAEPGTIRVGDLIRKVCR